MMTTMTRGEQLDALFAGIPWWEGTAIQFLCRVAAYGGAACLDPARPALVWLAFADDAAISEASAVRDAHEPEIAAALERCPGRRFPWWD